MSVSDLEVQEAWAQVRALEEERDVLRAAIDEAQAILKRATWMHSAQFILRQVRDAAQALQAVDRER